MTSCWHTHDAVGHMLSAYRHSLSILLQTPHISVLTALICTATARHGRRLKVLDIGCGTALAARFFKGDGHHYTGADLPHIIDGCAKTLNPMYDYRYMDWEKLTDHSFLQEYDLLLANAFIDVLDQPLKHLSAILDSGKPVILHRQEISMAGTTRCIQNPSYGYQTWHSIISRDDFMKLLLEKNYGIMDQGKCGFANWEKGGHSFLLEHQPSWALHKADHALVKLFKGKRNGFYIEAGANDGLRQSNTMLLHSHYGWKGILIEPVQEIFEKLTHNRPAEHQLVNAALVETGYGTEKCIIEYTPGCYGLMSTLKGTPFAKDHLDKAREDGIGVWAKAMPLNQILEEANPPEIDLLCLDIEGYEFKALHGIDFNTRKPHYLMIEQLDKSSNSIEKYLDPWYKRHDLLGENDVIYVRK